MLLTKQTKRCFTRDNAIKVAAGMQADDPEWTYVPVHDPKGTGWSFVEIYDEDGELLGEVR